MINELIQRVKATNSGDNALVNNLLEKEIPAKTILLREGDIATQIHFIQKGCLRMWFNKDGKDITFQFFFEDQPVASIESLINKQPSLFSIESIEPSRIISIHIQDFEKLYNSCPELKDEFQKMTFQRFSNYARLFLSRIKDTPQERYNDLAANHPEIIRRIPQHYIASYLGVTPVSLSRIRNRKQQ